MNLTIKPANPVRTTLTPSSFYGIRCPRCLWLQYWHGIQYKPNLNLQLHLADLQERSYDGVDSSLISSEIPTGKVSRYKEKFNSTSIKINGEETRWSIRGEIDLLVDHQDGTFSIIDGKVSQIDSSEKLISSYQNQLEAYAFSFENPLNGDVKPIRSIGLLQWYIDDAIMTSSNARAFSVLHRYVPVTRDESSFMIFLEKFIGIIEGNFPESGTYCDTCDFLKKVGFQYE